MTITFVGTSYGETGGVLYDPFDVPTVSGIADNDILLMTVLSYYSTVPSISGFTKKIDDGRDGLTTVWWKRASSESGDYTVDPSYGAYAQLSVWRGCVTSGDPFDDTDDWADPTSGTLLRSVLSPSEANCMGIIYGRYDAASAKTIAPASGWENEIVDTFWTEYGEGFWMAYKTLSSAGSTGDIDSTLSGAVTGRVALGWCLKAAPMIAAPSISAAQVDTNIVVGWT